MSHKHSEHTLGLRWAAGGPAMLTARDGRSSHSLQEARISVLLQL